ncbi:MAG: M28 family peptidase [Bacteroidales bacterium]
MRCRYFVLFFISLFAVQGFAQDINIARKSIDYLASDELSGRLPGTKGDSLSIDFITTQMKYNGLEEFDFGYVQPFELVTKIEPSDKCIAILHGKKLKMHDDFMPMSFSGNGALDAELVFMNFGNQENVSYEPGKWVLLLINNEAGEYPSPRELIKASLDAKKNGAAGVIFAGKHDLSENSEFLPFAYSRSLAFLDIPVIQVSAELLGEAMEGAHYSLSDLFNEKTDIQEMNETIDLQMYAYVEINKFYSETANIAGCVRTENSDSWLVIGAHYDHLGYGGQGSGSREPSVHAVHNGADDNASGVAMVLMLADYYAQKTPDVNLAFVLFGAEEQGLLGSYHFVENMPFPADKIKAMLNYDMVGRVEDSVLSISGVKTGAEFEEILQSFDGSPLKLSLGGGGYAGSDQASFYSENVPVLFFNSGLHDDYHTPADDVDKINFEGMDQIADLSIVLIDSLMKPETEISYQKMKKSENSRHGGDMKVSLGIMPDVAGREENGMAVDGVRPGGPADEAGFEKGDLIIAIGEHEISNIYDYMNILSDFDKGDTVEILIIRNEKEKSLEVEF